MRATFNGFYQGEKIYRFPVLVRVSHIGGSTECRVHILAPNAAAAANKVQAEFALVLWQPFETIAYGVKGGETKRFCGWESLVWRKLPSNGGRSENETELRLMLEKRAEISE